MVNTFYDLSFTIKNLALSIFKPTQYYRYDAVNY